MIPSQPRRLASRYAAFPSRTSRRDTKSGAVRRPTRRSSAARRSLSGRDMSDPGEEPARQDRSRFGRRDVDGARRVAVLSLHEEPLTAARMHEDPSALELLSVERENDPAFAHRLVESLVLFESIGPDVPDHHSPAAVLALGDHTFEARVIQRVVLDLHRQTLHLRIERRSFRYRPRRQDSARLQAEVVMQRAGAVLLDNEKPLDALPLPALRLGSCPEVALALVLAERARALFSGRDPSFPSTPNCPSPSSPP